MLRVGLTGGLASGKSTAAHLFAALGVHVIQADEVGRALMQPGHKLFEDLVAHFGMEILSGDGTLDRRKLADMAFSDGRLDELNRIVHPPVIEEQEAQMAAIFEQDKNAIVMIESALIFEASGEAIGETIASDASKGLGESTEESAGAPIAVPRRGTVPGWRKRFDRIILVTAGDEQKIARYVSRESSVPNARTEKAKGMEAGRLRLAAQIQDREKIPLADYIIDNSGPSSAMEPAVTEIYRQLRVEALHRK